MTLPNYTVSRTTSLEARAYWESAGAEDVSWVFINGFLESPLFAEVTTPRYMDFALPDGETAAVEIQDIDDDGDLVPWPITVRPNTLPTITWNSVADAVEYRIYQQEGASGSETLIATVEDMEDIIYDIELDEEDELNGAGGVWHFFRVESVDQYENESTRTQWAYWAYDTPAGITNLTVSDGSGSGLFDIEIEE